jgi:SAM-dependent methyltransferase
MSDTVVISYNRDSDGEFASLIYRKLKDEGFHPWMDVPDKQAGFWQPKVDQAILSSAAMILLISPASMTSRHVTYEWQFASGAGVEIIPIIVKETDQLHPKLELMNRLNFASNINLDELMTLLRRVMSDALTRRAREISVAIRQLKDNSHYLGNQAYSHVAEKSIDELLATLGNAGVKYSVPASEYPFYLLSLQKERDAKVKAIAIVDNDELFWQQRVGQEIMQTAHRDSSRIFIFPNVTKLEERFESLFRFAEKYNEYVMSGVQLSRDFPMFAEDFAIIQVENDKVLARYEEKSMVKMISFSADSTEVDTWESQINRMIRRAEKLTRSSTMDTARARIFPVGGQNLAPFVLKAIEMSAYISTDDYDQFEEYHPYYQDMMRRMIDEIPANGRATPLRVLEMGAGTGIFTKRLAAVPLLDCVAVELDWVCFKRLSHNMRRLTRSAGDFPSAPAALYNEDSITFTSRNPFDFIFSSFADHHIKTPHKGEYFANIRRNLSPGGKFVVGDEFLPPYAAEDKSEYHESLRTYHNHIIGVAERYALAEEEKLESGTLAEEEALEARRRATAYRELMELEAAALESGIEEQGDFKVSCEIYEAELEKSGLRYSKVKIGPLDDDSVGGIYVYTISVEGDEPQ